MIMIMSCIIFYVRYYVIKMINCATMTSQLILLELIWSAGFLVICDNGYDLHCYFMLSFSSFILTIMVEMKSKIKIIHKVALEHIM